MAETLVARSALRRHVAPEATPPGEAGVILRELTGLTLASVAAFRDGRGDLDEAARAAYGVDLPDTPRCATSGGVSFVWAGPGKWLAVSDGAADFAALPAAVAEQSDGRAVFEISGPRARELLATLVGIDLHRRAFQPGDVALTHAASIAVHLWQTDDAPTYRIACFRTFAATLWRWIVHAGAGRNIDARLG